MTASASRSVLALLALDVDELVKVAPALFQPATPGSHWSQLAVVVGRIEQEALYGPTFATARAYCAERLGLPPRDTEEYLKLWAMMTKHADVEPGRWETVPKAHAILLRQLFALGVHPNEYLDAYLKPLAFTAADLQAELDRRRGRDPWGRFEVDAPAATVTLAAQALTLAIREFGLDDLDALTDRATRHQLLEAVARRYIEGATAHTERDLLVEAVLERAFALVSKSRLQGASEAIIDLSNAVADLIRTGWRPSAAERLRGKSIVPDEPEYPEYRGPPPSQHGE